MNKKLSNRAVILLIILSFLSLIVSQMIAQLLGNIAFILPIPYGTGNIVYGITYVVFAYLLIKELCIKFGISPMQCRINKPNLRIRWIISALGLPVFVCAILLLFPGSMTYSNPNSIHIFNITTGAVFVYGLGAGIVEEMVFRGVIMSVIENRWGKKAAILYPSLFFGIVHIIGSKLNLVSILLLIIAGTSVGVMFSMVVYESGSIWNSAIMHGIWNAIMIGNILSIGTTYNKDAIYSYKLASKSIFLTGGEFGVEASFIAVLGYFLFAGIAYLLIKKKQEQA